jgi:2-polyprenyl-3-methyl-5-hydroxy-6-metoxy-1,4-benzoquinol methylase
MEPDRRRAWELAAESLREGDPTGWFEKLYREEEEGAQVVPWADRGPSPNLLEFSGAGKTALVVGCGFGDDAEQISKWGFETTAFDISETAIRACKRRFPESAVQYETADLFKPPAEWIGRFDFVLESNTVQALPREIRADAMRGIAAFVKKGGMILLIARAREEDEPEGQMPWPLTRRELDLFAELGLREESFEDYLDEESPPVRRFRAIFLK